MAKIIELPLSSDVIDLMSNQLQKLPAKTQQLLQLAACIGNQFDLATLAIVSEQSQLETADDLWQAVREGLIVPKQQTYRFLHDRVQQAAYAQIPKGQKEQTHLRIGRLLQKSQTEAEYLFEILSHFNRALALVVDSVERRSLIHLNLGRRSKGKSSNRLQRRRSVC